MNLPFPKICKLKFDLCLSSPFRGLTTVNMFRRGDQMNAAIYGLDVASYTLLNAMEELAYNYQFCIGKCPPPHLLSLIEPPKQRIITKTLEELLDDKRLHVIFLCISPQLQFKTLIRLMYLWNIRKHELDNEFNSTKDCLPHLILIPPVIHNYCTRDLSGFKNHIGIAMPLRRLVSIDLLLDHLLSIRGSKFGVHKTSSLPAYWILGELHYIHIRLVSTNLIQPGSSYSWLCEPGDMGGGILNRFGVDLIDLIYSLTGGLEVTSVSCMGRVFNSSLQSTNGISKNDTIKCMQYRKNSAEDFLVVTGELKMPPTGDISPYTTRSPVFMLCLSADCPPSIEGMPIVNDGLTITVEVAGSTGKFVIPDSGDQIQWSSASSNKFSVYVQPKLTVPKTYTDLSNSDKSTAYTNRYSNNNSKVVQELNYSVNISKKNYFTEVAHLITNPSAKTNRKYVTDAVRTAPVIQDAWFDWCQRLRSALMPGSGGGSGGTSPARKKSDSLDSLLASPDHWAYLQKVVRAIEKAARLRCTVEVETQQTL